MACLEFKLPADAPEDKLLDRVRGLNANPDVDGILVQLPVPEHMNENRVIAAIHPSKDVDGFNIINVGRLVAGLHGFVPCTPLGCLMLLKDRLGSVEGLEAVVVGRSNIVGKPMAALLTRENATVTLAHSRTRDLPEVVRRADIVVAAVGKPAFVKGSWLKPGATVIDVGINRVEGADGKARLKGDVDFDEAKEVAGAISPVPGGVGPMTIAVLLRNTIVSAYRREGLGLPRGLL
jgi:methylenetetrahydrofolate dehydrogenase (NADP+)/methenyltetrahydrofolate cyclohydrolase